MVCCAGPLEPRNVAACRFFHLPWRRVVRIGQGLETESDTSRSVEKGYQNDASPKTQNDLSYASAPS
jgi:hypothetical protein